MKDEKYNKLTEYLENVSEYTNSETSLKISRYNSVNDEAVSTINDIIDDKLKTLNKYLHNKEDNFLKKLKV